MGSQAATGLPVITWDYAFAPNAQKARNLLHATGIPYQCCEQPFVLPRPILTDLGITYRRVPVISIGKDVYCDNKVFLEAVQSLFKDKALPETPADHAFESFGYRSFWISLPLVPAELMTPQLAKDRANLFPVFARPDFADLRPNGLGEFKHMLDNVEQDFLGHGKGPFLNGSQIGVADIHAVWMIKWALQTLDVAKDPGFGREDFPKVYKWIEGLPRIDEEDKKLDKISPEQAQKMLFGSGYAAPDIGVYSKDPLGLSKGDKISVEAADAVPGTYPQEGKLVGLTSREVVLELENSLRIHFPRIGYFINKL